MSLYNIFAKHKLFCSVSAKMQGPCCPHSLTQKTKFLSAQWSSQPSNKQINQKHHKHVTIKTSQNLIISIFE